MKVTGETEARFSVLSGYSCSYPNRECPADSENRRLIRHGSQAHGEHVWPDFLQEAQMEWAGQIFACELADVAKVPERVKGIPDARIVETTDADLSEPSVAQQAPEQQLAEKANMDPVVSVYLRAFRLGWHLRSEKRQQPPAMITEIWNRCDQDPSRFQHPMQLLRGAQRIKQVLKYLHASRTVEGFIKRSDTPCLIIDLQRIEPLVPHVRER